MLCSSEHTAAMVQLRVAVHTTCKPLHRQPSLLAHLSNVVRNNRAAACDVPACDIVDQTSPEIHSRGSLRRGMSGSMKCHMDATSRFNGSRFAAVAHGWNHTRPFTFQHSNFMSHIILCGSVNLCRLCLSWTAQCHNVS